MCPERSHEIPSSRLLNYFLPAENYSWAISILAEILASPVSSLRSHSYLYSPFLLLISLTNVIGYVIFLYHILVKTIPSRRGCTRKAKVFSPMRETLAILAMISSAMILPIQYLNAPDPSDVHRFACVRFISGQRRLPTPATRTRPLLIRVRLFSISYHLMSFTSYVFTLHMRHISPSVFADRFFSSLPSL